MRLPESLSFHVGVIRSGIANLDFTNANAHGRNVAASLENIRKLIEANDRFDHSADMLTGAVLRLVDAAADGFAKSEAADSRRKALIGVRTLEEALSDCRPSSYAKALGCDW